MTNWKHTLRFEQWYHDDDISIKEKAELAAKELKITMKLFRFKDDDDLEEIIENFEGVSGDGEQEETTEFTIREDFNARMSELYDWADNNSVWVSTFA
ncbi:hypothetical protein KAR91_17710 [Candidatus Pacearchaeota archaeon]|nr:hypothetical protein [Candidatus Pacearchaeota archaeon]